MTEGAGFIKKGMLTSMRKHIKSVMVTLLMVGVLISAFAFAPAAFAAEDATLELEATISLTDHPAGFSEDYTIVLEAEKTTNPMPSGSSNGVYEKTRTGAGEIDIDTITYTKPGIYKYTVSLKEGSADRWTYDDAVYNVTVYATNSESGDGLDVNVAIYKDGEDEKTSEIIFINVYDPLPVSVEVNATKTMDGKTPENGAFTFVIKDSDGNVVETVSNTDAVVSFSDLVFEETGVYTYTVSEVKGTDKKITYDTTKYTVIVTVTQDGDLVADVAYQKNGKAYDGELVFANVTGPVMGDDTNLGLWIGIFAVSAVAIVCLLVFGRKRKKDDE